MCLSVESCFCSLLQKFQTIFSKITSISSMTDDLDVESAVNQYDRSDDYDDMKNSQHEISTNELLN